MSTSSWPFMNVDEPGSGLDIQRPGIGRKFLFIRLIMNVKNVKL